MAAVGQRIVLGPFHSSGILVTAPEAFTYEPGTTTNKTTWTDRAKSTSAANPVVGSDGLITFFGDGLYKIVIKNTAGSTLETWDNFQITNHFQYLTGTVVFDPGSLVDGAGETKTSITITGAEFGDFVLISAPYDLQDLIVTGYVSAANTVEIRVQNESTATVDLASGTWDVRVLKEDADTGSGDAATSGLVTTYGNGNENNSGLLWDGNEQDFYFQLDDSDNTLKIGLGSTVGTTEFLSFSTAGVVFNEDSNNYDFRIEGDGNSNLFVLDAGIDSIGIGGAVVTGSLLALTPGDQAKDLITSVGLGFHIAADTIAINAAGNNETIAIGALAFLGIPTLTSVGTDYIVTDAGTLTVEGIPVGSTNVTVTNGWAINCVAGGINLGGGNLKFPATQVDNSNVNTLDDYEEGTFNPTAIFAAGSGDIMYTTQNGRYTKIGNMVFFDIRLTTSSIASRTGAMTIGALPFTVGATHRGCVTVGFSGGVAITATESVTGLVVNATTTINMQVWNAATGTTAMQHSEWTDDGDAALSGHYFV